MSRESHMTTTEPVHPPLSSGYSELVREIRGQVLLHRRPRYYLALGAINLFCLMAVVAGLILLRDSWWTVLLAPVLAVVSTQIAFLSHDTAHSQVCRGRTRTVLCLVQGNLLSGLSYGWWVDKHNAHHAHPNDLETDPDVAVGALVWSEHQADERQGAAAWLTAHQAGLFFPFLLGEAVNLHVASVRG